MAKFEGYFDESGDLEVEPGVFCVAGYFIYSEAAKLMKEEWNAVLGEHGIPYFHMVECAHGNKCFVGMPVEERITIVKKLIALIKKYTIEGISFLIRAETYSPPSKKRAPDPYSQCASGCAEALIQFLMMSRIEAEIAYYFEDGHKNKRSAYNHIAHEVKRDRDTLTFAAKTEAPLLQAADLLAWQSAKYAKDYFFARWAGQKPKRSPRKDFQSLMEHDHTFMYLGADGAMGIELWPISKRTQFTENIELKDDGPAPYWHVKGEDVPIFPIERSLGWRMGGAKFSYLMFNGFQNKKFALAFDEPRLFEAIGMLLAATSLYKESELMPVISPENIDFVESHGDKVLRIKIPDGANLGIKLNEKIEKQLRVIFSGSSNEE